MDLPSLRTKGPAVVSTAFNSNTTLSQGAEIRAIDYANEVYGLSKVKASMLRMYVRSESTNDDFKLFDRRHIRRWSPVTKSIDTTPNTPQSFDRRAMYLNPFEDAIIVDKSDMVKSRHDILSQAKIESAQALGRLQDSLILQAFFKPTFVQKAVAKTELPELGDLPTDKNALITVESTLEKKWADNIFYDDKETLHASDRSVLFDAKDTIERVKKVFRKRAVPMGDLYCTLTPDLEDILMRDSEFNARERIMRPGISSSGKVDGGFVYRGINFVRTYDRYGVYPAVNVNWAGGKASATPAAGKETIAANNVRNKVVAKKLSEGAKTIDISTDNGSGGVKEDAKSSEIGITASTGKYLSSADRAVGGVALGTTHKTLQVEGGHDIAVFWDSGAVLFGERAGDTFSRSSERADLRHADQLYMRAAFGSLVIDPECVLGLVVEAKEPAAV